MTLGQRLAALRKGKNLTQQQLGEQLNVSAQAISKWENDQAEPDVSTIIKLSEIYEISVSELLKGESDAPPVTVAEGEQPEVAPAAEKPLFGERLKVFGKSLLAHKKYCLP